MNITKDQIRAAGGIVHSDGNVFFTSIDQLNAIMRGVAAEPVGWKRVPIEPTPEMCQSGGKAMFTAAWESEDAEAADIYSAMLKAAPEAP